MQQALFPGLSNGAMHRFRLSVPAAFLNANCPVKLSEQENVMRLFHTLGNVAMVEGSAQMGDGTWERTIFTSCFSAKTGTYYYSTDDNPALRCSCLNDYQDAATDSLIEPEAVTARF